MAYKFPWTNYHELNLDWILNTVKELFAKTEQNNAIVEQYDGRLTEVELTADNAQTAAGQALENSTAAIDLAQNAQTTATQAQQAAGQAQQAAGQAQTAAGQALEAAATAQQTATQAQQTAQNFDGRITQAENNAANALQAAQAFDEQVQGAITAANNANEAATNAVTVSAAARQIAADANQKSDRTAAQLNAQINTITQTINSQLDAAETAIENKGEEVLNSIPEDYTSISNSVSMMPLQAFSVLNDSDFGTEEETYTTLNRRVTKNKNIFSIRPAGSSTSYRLIRLFGGMASWGNVDNIVATYADSLSLPTLNSNVPFDFYLICKSRRIDTTTSNSMSFRVFEVDENDNVQRISSDYIATVDNPFNILAIRLPERDYKYRVNVGVLTRATAAQYDFEISIVAMPRYSADSLAISLENN